MNFKDIYVNKNNKKELVEIITLSRIKNTSTEIKLYVVFVDIYTNHSYVLPKSIFDEMYIKDNSKKDTIKSFYTNKSFGIEKELVNNEFLYNKLKYLGIINDSDIRNTNIGKSNYSKHLIQPWTIWLDYPELTSWDCDIIKRILRTKEEEGLTELESRELDYNKIIHICKERLRQIEFEKKGIKYE